MADSYTADFGRTADDYATHRAGFPPVFILRLRDNGIGVAGQTVLDLGTGTGSLARGMAASGALVTGVDPAADMLDQARRLAAAEGLSIGFQVGTAERTGQPDAAFDVVTAGQCWHWFDGPAAFAEIGRVLEPGGRLAICHFDWLPLKGSVVAATERLILAHSPDWPFAGGTGIYPAWTMGMAEAGFADVQTFSFEHPQRYSHESWRGRIRASAPIGGTLPPAAVEAFDREHAAMLARDFPDDPMTVPHRCWAAIGTWAGAA